MRIYNYVRCVRGGVAEPRTSGPPVEMKYQPRQMQYGRSPMGQNNQMIGQNRNGQPMAGRGQSGEDFVRRLDRDGDGKVSRQEFDGPDEQFPILDKNKDGYLSSNEAPQMPPADGQRRQQRP